MSAGVISGSDNVGAIDATLIKAVVVQHALQSRSRGPWTAEELQNLLMSQTLVFVQTCIFHREGRFRLPDVLIW